MYQLIWIVLGWNPWKPEWCRTGPKLGRLFPPSILQVRKQESLELSPMARWWQSWHPRLGWFTPNPVIFIRGASYYPHRPVFHVSGSLFVIRSQTALGLEDPSEMFGPHFTLTGEASAMGLYWFALRVHACAQSCPALWDPMDCSPPGSSVHGISQARIPEWVPISFSRGSSQPRDQTQVPCIGRQILYHWATRESSSLFGLL